MKSLPIGTKVTLRESSRFFGTNPGSNPAGVVGVVINYNPRNGCLPYRVKWLHEDISNNYSREDLRYWRGPLPDYARAPVNKPENPGEAKLPEEVILNAQTAMDKQSHECTARYAFLHKDDFKINTNTACHATVLVYEGVNRNRVLGILTSIKSRRKEGKPWSSTYYEWLFNHSPWASVFEWKDVEYCQRVGYVLVRTDVPGNLMQAGLIATRQPWEHPKVISSFEDLVDRGIEGNLAFFLASCFRVEEGYVHPSRHSGGHFPLEVCDMGPKGIKAFLEGAPLEVGPIYRGSDGYVRDIHAAFSSGGGAITPENILKRCKPKVNKTQVNPFAKARPKKEGTLKVRVEDFVAYVKEHPIYE